MSPLDRETIRAQSITNADDPAQLPDGAELTLAFAILCSGMCNFDACTCTYWLWRRRRINAYNRYWLDKIETITPPH